MERPQLEAELERVHAKGFAWALTCCEGDRAEAEDVLHGSYLKVLEGRARFEGRSRFDTWLFGVIRVTARERRRGWWRQAARLGLWWRDRDRAAEPDPGGSEEQVAGLRRALAMLSTRQAEVLHLVFYQGLTIEGAAEVLGLRVGTARTHYERGKARLRVLLERQGGTHDGAG